MGIIGRLIDHIIDKRIELILETKAGFNQKTTLYNPSGDASIPCKNDRLLLVKAEGTGRYVAIGVLNEAMDAHPGEKIFYSRDDQGNLKAILRMLNNGEIHLNNDGKKAARIEDKVKVIIPANTFIVTVAGGSGAPATGTPNAVDMEFEGEIIEGSQKVFIGD